MHTHLLVLSCRGSTVCVSDVSGNQSQNPHSDDFDMFAQSRKSFDQNKENLRFVLGISVWHGQTSWKQNYLFFY